MANRCIHLIRNKKNKRMLNLKLTVKEAIEQGYTLCGYDDKDYQSLRSIDSLTDEDFDAGKIMVAEKEPMNIEVDADSISDYLADWVTSIYGENSGDDSQDLYDEIRELNFDAITAEINSKIANHPLFHLEEIELVKSGQEKI